MSKIVFSIQYAGLTLPVIQKEGCPDSTALKPISDLFGLQWQRQRGKVTESDFLMRHLSITFVETASKTGDSGMAIPTSNPENGTKTEDSGADMYTSNPENRPRNPTYLPEVLIRVDRVEAYLMTINPDKVRAGGNVSGADFLEAKMSEWADAVHAYEKVGVAVNLNHIKSQELLRKQRFAFARMIGIKNQTSNSQDRKALGQVTQQMAAELGITYQLDLDEAGQSTQFKPSQRWSI